MAPGAPSSESPAQAADLSQFRPGNIISDRVFFNSGSMNEGQVQSFLNARVPSCASGYVCLKNYSQNTWTRPADRYCPGTYAGGSGEPAARIIVKVAAACGINPQVLIVTLQKEQGLVTLTAPSSGRYQIAMGFACPDTAACDSQYYGFFNQVYSAARQFKVYGNSTTFTWYAPGRVANVRYNPDASCGSSPVYIENQATANLYYYTPYQPNAAALAAGYGTGNGCSAYGNRNFYNYFTDWFGSTQVSSGSLVQVPGRPEVWLVVANAKHHVREYGDLMVFASRLGGVTSVSGAYLDSLITATPATRYVHDPGTGTLYLLQADGTKHRFPSVDMVTAYGYAFDEYINLESAQTAAFATGAEVGPFFRIESAPETFLLDGSAKRYVTTARAWIAASSGKNTFVAGMAAERAAKLQDGPAVLEPNSLVRETGSGEVMLATGDRSMIHIPSFELAAEFGAVSYAVVGNGVLAKQTRTPGELTPFVSCAGSVYLGAGGRAYPVNGSLPAGWSATALASDGCAAMPKAAAPLTAPFFVQPSGRGEVYHLVDGAIRHVRAYQTLVEINGSRPLTILSWSQGTVRTMTVGAPYLENGSFVQFATGGEVYYVESGKLRHVQEYSVLVRLGGGRVPTIERLPDAYRSSYVLGAPYS